MSETVFIKFLESSSELAVSNIEGRNGHGVHDSEADSREQKDNNEGEITEIVAVLDVSEINSSNLDGLSYRVEWLVFDNQSEEVMSQGSGSLIDAAKQLTAVDTQRRYVALVPSDSVLITEAKIPSKQSRYIAQALPYMIEEQIANDIEDMHLAIGPLVDNQVNIVAVSHQQISDWLAAIKAVGINIQALIPDVFLIPQQEAGDWVVILDDEKCLLRTDIYKGYSIDTVNLLPMLELIVEESGSKQKETPEVANSPELIDLVVLANRDDARKHHLMLSRLDSELVSSFNVERQELDYRPFETVCRHYVSNAGRVPYIDLLQGEYLPKRNDKSLWKQWRPVAYLAVAFFLVQLGLDASKGYYYALETDKVSSDIVGTYKKLFPNDTRVSVDDLRISYIRNQINNLLNANEGNTQGGFINLFGQMIFELNKLKLEGVEIQNIRYRENRGDIDLEVIAPRVETVVAFQNALNNSQFSAEITSSNQIDGGARVRMKVRPIL